MTPTAARYLRGRRLSLLLTAFFVSASIGAQVPETAAVRESLQENFPAAAVSIIEPSPIAGVYEVTVNGEIIYITQDGRYALTGDLVDLDTQRNLTEAKLVAQRLKLVEAIGVENMIVFSPKTPKRTITVFTDVDCPYCRKFHKDVPELNNAGVAVRYLLFPRGGIDSPSYERHVSVWCAEDRRKAIGRAKAGEQLPNADCDNPVAEHYRLGELLRIRGTPTIMLDYGQILQGYVPTDNLLAILGLRNVGATDKASLP